MSVASETPAVYPRTEATTPTRLRDRMRYDADTVHAILDDAFLAHVSFTADGLPHVLPLAFGRDGSRVYMHVSSGGHLAAAVRHAGDDGLPVAFAVTHADGVVLSRSAFHHSLNYRCVIAHGPLRRVTDPEELAHGWSVLLDHMVPGRSVDARPPNRKEAAQTGLFALDLDRVAAKVRDHGLGAEEEGDLELPHWAGVIPLRTVAGPPQPDTGVGAVPDYLARWAAEKV